jgi:D-mannonate dehydratase
MRELLDKISKEELLGIIYELSELSNTMKMSTQKNIIFQTGILKLCMEIQEIKEPVKNAKVARKVELPEVKEIKSTAKPIVTMENTEINQDTKLETDTMNYKYVQYWKNVLEKIKQAGKMTIYANLLGTKGVLVNDMVVGIEFPKKVTDFAKKVIEENENKHLIENIVSMEQGAQMQIRILDKDDKKQESKKSSIENIASELDIPINIIDE